MNLQRNLCLNFIYIYKCDRLCSLKKWMGVFDEEPIEEEFEEELATEGVNENDLNVVNIILV